MLLEELGGLGQGLDDMDLAAEAEFGVPSYQSQDNPQARVLSEEKRTSHHENLRDGFDRALQMVQRPATLEALGQPQAPMPNGPGMNHQMNPNMDPRRAI